MKSLELKKDVYWVGALDPELRIFDIIMYTPYGTTYNSYVVKGSEKTAVIETVKVQFFEQYLERLQSLDVDITKIDYIVVNHTEPDHAGSVAKLLELSKNAKLVGSAPALRFMKKIANREFESITVGDGNSLSLGNKTLKFISAPFLHWPDSIYTYLEEDAVLFTCDSFGSHYCNAEMFNDLNPNEDQYMEALRYYYDCIMGPFKPYVLKAIDKIKDLKIDMICNGHGPILRENPWRIVELYKAWSTPKPLNRDKGKITISYVSAYGYTEQLAQKISEGICSTGDFDISLYDVIYHDKGKIVEEISESDGILFGSPTINGDLLEPIRDILTKLNPLVHGGKVAAGFGSYGWSGEAVPNIENRLKELRMKIQPGLKINFKPSEEDLQKAFEFGVEFGKRVLVKLGKLTTEALPEEAEKKSNSVEALKPQKFIIIGNGAAGYAAAGAIRKNNAAADIKLICAEKELTYYRPQLSEYIAVDNSLKKFYVAPEDWYKDNNIELILGVKASAIDKVKKTVELENGVELSYDRLILANGSSNFIPSIKGTDLEGVYTLKYKADADNIKAAMCYAKNAVVIGGGLLGLEAAWEMKKSGLKVSVVEFIPRLLPKQLDEKGSELFQAIAQDSGIELILGDSVDEIVSDETGRKAKALKLKSGKLIEADLILFSVGIRPNKALAENAGIASNRGVIVNEKMETNTEGVYACGDVAELGGLVYGTWPAAMEMGKIAGKNASGEECYFKYFSSSVMFKALNAEIFSAGTIDFNDCSLKHFAHEQPEKGIYKKLFFKDNLLVGAILMGDIKKAPKVLASMKKGAGENIVDEIFV